MPLNFTIPRRRPVRRRHVNHREPTTIREKLIAGLEVLNYERLTTKSSKYDAFSPPTGGDRKWYVGDNGALRIGTSISTSAVAGETIREYVLTAPVVKPIVVLELENVKDPPANGEETALATRIRDSHEELKEISIRVITAHIRRIMSSRTTLEER
jgi:hypothetical protein